MAALVVWSLRMTGASVAVTVSVAEGAMAIDMLGSGCWMSLWFPSEHSTARMATASGPLYSFTCGASAVIAAGLYAVHCTASNHGAIRGPTGSGCSFSRTELSDSSNMDIHHASRHDEESDPFGRLRVRARAARLTRGV